MAHNDGSEGIASQDGFGVSIRDLPMALWLLLKNPVNMLNNIADVTEGLVGTGLATFIPKFIENQYGVTAAAAGTLVGKLVLSILFLVSFVFLLSLFLILQRINTVSRKLLHLR